MMNKKTLFVLALAAGLFFIPASNAFSAPQVVTTQAEGEIPNAVLQDLFDQLVEMKYGTIEEMELWYKTGELKLKKESANSYQYSFIGGGGVGVLITGNL